MRTPADLPRPRSRRRFSRRVRVVVLIAVSALIVLLLSLRGIAGFYTDYLWFDALDYTSVWRRVLLAKIALGAIFVGIFFVLMFLNLYIADRLAPVFRPPGPEEELLSRYHSAVGRRSGWVHIGVSLFFALVAGVGASGQWENWILFTHRVDFGIKDPQFDTDIGFYVFQLPFLTYVVGWAFTAFIIILIVTAIAHYVNGGIRVQTPGQRVTPHVKAHLSVLLGALALIKAADYWLDRFGLTLSTRGAVDGASYTDVNAQLPAIHLLLLISLLAFLLLLVNIRRKGWVLPSLAVGLWAFVAIVMGSIYPAFVQRFQVQPNESNKEEEFIARNLEATKAAFALDAVSTNQYAYDEALTGAELLDNEATIRNIRLLDPAIVPNTFEQLQAERDFYRFGPDLDVDRYEINGRITQVVLGARQLNAGDIPDPTWEKEHLSFTNGYGVALSPANAVTETGRPDFVIGGVPVENETEVVLDQPQLYFGEGLGGYSIVNTDIPEVGFVDDSGLTVEYRYEGDAGVELGGFFRRSMFALRFADINPLISNPVSSDSRIIFIRDIRSRVQKLAPFLDYDSDPYPVIHDGRIVYLMDAFTTSSNYPYSQQAERGSLPSGSGLNHRFNYVRNSVKVVVDGFDGDVSFYVIDQQDPLIRGYRNAFPDLFTDFDEMPEDLRNHIRYPEDLFRVQTNMWGRYHIEDPKGFYEQAGGWAVAQDPGTSVTAPPQVTTQTTSSDGTVVTTSRERRIDPYYMLLRLPDEPDAEFVVLRSFVPVSARDDRKELTAFMVARSDPENYGQLVVYEMPGTQVDGPGIVNSNILTEELISDRITQLNQQGSTVRLGNLLLLPIEDSILYVRPLYVEASSGSRIPELKNVIVAFGDEVVIDQTLRAALEQLFGAAPETLEAIPDEAETPPDDAPADEVPADEDEPPADTDPTPTPVPAPDELTDLLTEADALFDEADEALRNGDLGEYQRLTDQARALIADVIGQVEGDAEEPDIESADATEPDSA